MAKMPSVWTYRYGNNTITVKNKRATELYVNDKLCDKVKGLHIKAEMACDLDTGEKVYVRVFGTTTIECLLTIDNVIQEPVEIS